MKMIFPSLPHRFFFVSFLFFVRMKNKPQQRKSYIFLQPKKPYYISFFVCVFFSRGTFTANNKTEKPKHIQRKEMKKKFKNYAFIKELGYCWANCAANPNILRRAPNEWKECIFFYQFNSIKQEVYLAGLFWAIQIYCFASTTTKNENEKKFVKKISLVQCFLINAFNIFQYSKKKKFAFWLS